MSLDMEMSMLMTGAITVAKDRCCHLLRYVQVPSVRESLEDADQIEDTLEGMIQNCNAITNKLFKTVQGKSCTKSDSQKSTSTM